ncbi:hypothetical protein BVRB_2g026580 isoform A [Beta vulgaris subsp. vulgaris]|uniref:cell number regulator 10 n=1 Tax=Beta vulgaris subsp. vulgaris TaxID=3555 RepID=UPI0005402FDB|nr:cell number regulator 10 [Beta vulgaris subsp. vulgaris]KMT18519.1 hypothetical protein BVRB_2g026580 isoform A [Beta vulgaris subsp. vulgaris]
MKQQYAMEIPVHAPTIVGAKEFSTGINGCFSDVSLCCLTCWCPCITFGRIAEIVDKGSSSSGTNGAIYSLLMFLSGCHFMYSCMYRSKMRAQFGMPEDNCRDFVAHFCCERRALCQEYRELQYHGYDPALGWQGQKQNQGLVAPPMPGGMTR